VCCSVLQCVAVCCSEQRVLLEFVNTAERVPFLLQTHSNVSSPPNITVAINNAVEFDITVENISASDTLNCVCLSLLLAAKCYCRNE